MSVKLTSYSHGAGCGCKLSPAVLSEILSGPPQEAFPHLLVGNEKKDDAAVIDLDGETAIISTTDFFMPIVDDPSDFGGIAAVNAISDIYAMGGTPLMAIAILGWPVDKLSTDVAREVLNGARKVCTEAGIPLAGGHSIDTPEPIFGLAVTGKVPKSKVLENGKARENDLIYLTKPVGVGLITTAQKQGKARPQDLKAARDQMLQLNSVGALLSNKPYVHAMTDVTGFGLAGHLLEMAEASQLTALIERIPAMDCAEYYLSLGTSPGGTHRNWQSYGDKIKLSGDDYRLIADPQTSGGLLISINPEKQKDFETFMQTEGYDLKPLGRFVRAGLWMVEVF
jgi:selenide,water dikinase